MVKFFMQKQRVLTHVLLAGLFLSSCSSDRSEENRKNYYHNDLESYEGWIGTSGLNLTTKDAHSGKHACETNPSTAVYSLTFSRKLSELSNLPVKNVQMSLWVKFSEASAKGAYVLSIENEGKTLSYFSFAVEDFAKSPNQWYQVKGAAVLPKGLGADDLLKIYFWNKGQSEILIDDFEFSFGN